MQSDAMKHERVGSAGAGIAKEVNTRRNHAAIAKGMNSHEIAATIEALCGDRVSASLILAVTKAANDELIACHARMQGYGQLHIYCLFDCLDRNGMSDS